MLLKKKPDHLAVAFDKGGRIIVLKCIKYKAHRDETPEAIKIAVHIFQKLLR